MKLLIINHYANIPSEPGGTRHFDLAKNLIKLGWDVTIVASSVNHFNSQDRLRSSLKSKIEVYEGIKFLWIKTNRYFGNSLGRIINILAFTLRFPISVFRRGIEFDIAIGSTVHPFAALFALYFTKFKKKKFIFEIRDLWPETLIEMGAIKRQSLISKFFFKIESTLLYKSDHVISVLPNILEYTDKLGISQNKVTWVSNFSNLPNYTELQKSAGGNNRFIFMYLGSLGQANGIETIIEAIKIAASEKLNIVLKVYGDGPLKENLKKENEDLIKQNYLEFNDSVKKHFIPSIAEEADCFILHFLDKPKLYKYGISPNKIFEYMSLARPIIFAGNVPNNYILESGCGISVKPECSASLFNAIKTITMSNQIELSKMGQNGREFIEKSFSAKIMAAKLNSILEATLKD
jgi:glycosyltransferase involved in cell wall biosynthesis